MFIGDIFRIGAKNLRTNRMRTWLTVMSIAIGVASVVLIVSMSDSGQQAVSDELDKLGIHGMTLYSKNAETMPLTVEDVEKIKEKIPEISDALPLVVEYGSYRIKNTNGDTVIWGIDDGISNVMTLDLLFGRLPNETDVRFKKNVAVVDSELAKKVYKRENIVGKNIVLTIGNESEKFEIIGIISSQKDGINQISGGMIPDFMYIPYTTANRMTATYDIDQIAINCMSELPAEQVGKKAVEVLNRENNTKDGYSTENLTGHVNSLKSIVGLIGLLLSAIAAISLCVSGLGIMNTTLSSAGERKKEIGICMAIGARKRDIAMCFLAESALISAIGGAIGGVSGLGISVLIIKLLNMKFSFSIKNLLLVEAVAIFCGIVFAVLPAISASKLDPITALRDDN